MSWAMHAKEALRKGETVQIRPRGNSMRGKVNDGALVLRGVHPRMRMEILGHSQIHITMTRYAHVIQTSREEAAQRLHELFKQH